MTAATGHARPLEGRRVLVTRPRAQALDLVQSLEANGATAIVSPTIRIVPPDDRGPLLAAAGDPSAFDWIVFASTNAVDAFLDAAREQGRLFPFRTPAGAHPLICAVGSRTAEQLRERGVNVDLVPAEFRAEALVDALTTRTKLTGTRVLLPRSEIGRTTIADRLRAAGALVTEVVAYRTIAEAPEGEAPDVRQLLVQRQLDAVTFTSGSAVRSFMQVMGPDTVDLLGHTVVAVIGPVTADVARECRITVHVQPATYTVAAMVDALAAHFAGA